MKSKKKYQMNLFYVGLYLLVMICPFILLYLLGVDSLFMLFYAFFAFFLTVLFYYIMVHRHIKNLIALLKKLNDGDFDASFDVSCSVHGFKEIKKIIDIFTTSIFDGLIKELKMDVLKTQDNSNMFLTEVQKAVTNASRISLGAGHISARVENLESLLNDSLNENNAIKDGIDEYESLVSLQNSSINQTGDVIKQIVTSLNQSIEEIAQRKKISTHMTEVTQEVSVKVKNTVSAVTEISEGIGLIKDTIQIVASVAARTNLLAMNAAIEAAHAGEAGAGFAVVAEEIRKLAEATAKQVQTITGSLKGVSTLIEQAVKYSLDTGNAFSEINDVVSDFVGMFDELTEGYSELAVKNEKIEKIFSIIKDYEVEMSSRIGQINGRIDKTIKNLDGIRTSNNEISIIVDRNAKEALELSRAQAPIYTNAIDNGENLERIRKLINTFHLKGSSREMWLADKSELYQIIAASFAHLDWTVSVLDFVQGDTNSYSVLDNSDKFSQWLEKSAKKLYGDQDCYKKIVEQYEIIKGKARLVEKLSIGKKEQEASIEFAEMLENSREMIVLLNELKLFIIKNRINPETKKYGGSGRSCSIKLIKKEDEDEFFTNFDIPSIVHESDLEDVEELEELFDESPRNESEFADDEAFGELQDFVDTLN